jgi:hypothetical protein
MKSQEVKVSKFFVRKTCRNSCQQNPCRNPRTTLAVDTTTPFVIIRSDQPMPHKVP